MDSEAMDDSDWAQILKGLFGEPSGDIHTLSGRLGHALNDDAWATVKSVADQAYYYGKSKGEEKWIS